MTTNPSLINNPNLDTWIKVKPNGFIEIRIGKVDIGQKISHAATRLVAEELDVNVERILVVPANTANGPNEGMTSGSNSIEESGNAIRLVAATARSYLLNRAAELLKVDPKELSINDGTIKTLSTNQTITYWELQGNKLFEIEIDHKANFKPHRLTHLIGRASIPNDINDIVSGKHSFVQDMSMPGMLHARIIRPPHPYARLKSVNEDILEKLSIRGFYIVRNGSFIAIAGEDEYSVIKAVHTLKNTLTWAAKRDLGQQTISQQLTSNKRISMPVIDGIPKNIPVSPPHIPSEDSKLNHECRYERPYIMHGSIGPSAALVLFKENRFQIWTHSQGIHLLRLTIAEFLSLSIDDITVYHRPGPGCYGHNGADDAALDAVLVAQTLKGKPILLKWSREDEHAWEPYGSAMIMDLSASVDNQNSIVAWSHETYSDTHVSRPRPGVLGLGPSRLLATQFLESTPNVIPPPPNMNPHGGIHRNLDPLYKLNNKRLIKHLVRNLPLRTSALRTLGAYSNIFAIESFIDELAAKLNEDPVEFRLRHLDDDRACACIQKVSERIGVLERAAEGIGRGLAFARYKNTKAYVSVGIELIVDDNVSVRLKKAVIASDAGQIIDPNGIIAQLEGGFIQAASWTLYEAVNYDSEGILSRDWDSYKIIGFDNIPEIETILLGKPDQPFLGVGEAVCGPTAGAIANAICRATGIRPRRLPFTPEILRETAFQ